ncbi:MAG TPA: c-type cytochrome biogenesis protein CcmI [Burkholderiales bacterium]|nr:c-type cytochrome biogenesis protein CcmI [Burkholderiales bacterium]
MIAFLIAVAVLVAVALAFVVPVLASGRRRGRVSRDAVNTAVYRDQLRELDSDLAAGTLSPQHYDKARRELEARLLADVAATEASAPAAQRGVRSAVVAAVAIPLLAGTVYLLVGTPRALAPEATAPRDAADTVTAEQIAAMVEKLASRLKQNPGDAEGWAMLGRSYTVLGRHDEAAAAYRNAVERLPDNARLLTDYADALAMSRGRDLAGEPEKLLARALEIEPDNPKALALGGTAAFKRRDYAHAVRLWERLLAQLPPGSEIAKAVQGSIDEARAEVKKDNR